MKQYLSGLDFKLKVINTIDTHKLSDKHVLFVCYNWLDNLLRCIYYGTEKSKSFQRRNPVYKNILAAVVVIFLLHISARAGEPSKAENFTLKDYKGVEHSLSDYKDAKAIVIMFIATQCPVSNGYNTRMEKLYEDYKNKGVVFLGINSNKQEDVKEIASHAKEHNLNFTILKDPNNKIADRFDASVTPETYMLNKNFEILYHGRIDDSRRGDDVEHQDLRNALDQVLAGKKVTVAKTKAFGCTIKRVD